MQTKPFKLRVCSGWVSGRHLGGGIIEKGSGGQLQLQLELGWASLSKPSPSSHALHPTASQSVPPVSIPSRLPLSLTPSTSSSNSHLTVFFHMLYLSRRKGRRGPQLLGRGKHQAEDRNFWPRPLPPPHQSGRELPGMNNTGAGASVLPNLR